MRETLTEKFYIKNVLNSDCRLQNLLPLKGNKNITGKLYHARLQTYKRKNFLELFYPVYSYKILATRILHIKACVLLCTNPAYDGIYP